jgi:hypothetical protein
VGNAKRRAGTAELVYTPDITWNPFTNTAIGSGSFNVAVQQNQFWSKANTASQQARLGLITQPNAWAINGYQYNQIMYTHTLPGSLSWLSVTVGQYRFLAYDDSLYAGNAQTNFISFPLVQNATQTYPQGGLGAYAQAATPDGQFAVAGGFQSATNVTGESLTTRGFSTGKYAYFAEGEWWPSLLAGGDYSVLGYTQPSVPQQPTTSHGASFNGGYRLEMGPLHVCELCERNRDPDRDFGRVGWNPQQSFPAEQAGPGRARILLGQDQPEGRGPTRPDCGVGYGALLQLHDLQGLAAVLGAAGPRRALPRRGKLTPRPRSLAGLKRPVLVF